MRILLGTTSIYKRALFNKLGLEYVVSSPNFDEKLFLSKNSELPKKSYSSILAQKKAQSLNLNHNDMIIIAADQVCLMDDIVFHKSGNYDLAFKTLNQLNGKTHQLYTSYYMTYQDQVFQHTNITNLTMHSLDPHELERYIQLDLPYDCAGSYKLESFGATLFKSIETEDHHAIIGLPLLKLAQDLRLLGVKNFLGKKHE